MIIDHKVLFSLPPPPYTSTDQPTSYNRPLTLSTLPPHILLLIVYATFPTHPSIDGLLAERQRKALLWLAKSLRLVNRSLYIACMHVLRSTYLPAYTALLRPYYSSDPFPSTPVPQVHDDSLHTIQRETLVLDTLIALKVREDVCVDDSEYHLEREDMFADLFNHNQPKARLEDLVRLYGVQDGVVTLALPGVAVYTTVTTSVHEAAQPDTALKQRAGSSASKIFSIFKRGHRSPSPTASASSRPSTRRIKIQPLPFSLLSVSFNTRTIGLQLMSAETGTKRTIVEVQRTRQESLESSASLIIDELKQLLTS